MMETKERVGRYVEIRTTEAQAMPAWPGQSIANRVLLQTMPNGLVSSEHNTATPKAPRHRLEPDHLPDTSMLYHEHVLETWPDDSAFTVAHQNELKARLIAEPVVTRRLLREQERIAEQRKQLEQPAIRRLGNTCLNWALSKIAK